MISKFSWFFYFYMFSDETMTVETFFGCAFVAYGLPLALFTLTIAKVGFKMIIQA